MEKVGALNTTSCMGVTGEGGWSKDGKIEDAKPKTARGTGLGLRCSGL